MLLQFSIEYVSISNEFCPTGPGCLSQSHLVPLPATPGETAQLLATVSVRFSATVVLEEMAIVCHGQHPKLRISLASMDVVSATSAHERITGGEGGGRKKSKQLHPLIHNEVKLQSLFARFRQF